MAMLNNQRVIHSNNVKTTSPTMCQIHLKISTHKFQDRNKVYETSIKIHSDLVFFLMRYPNNWFIKKCTFQSVSKFPVLSFILTQYEGFLKWEVPPNHPFHWRFFYHPDPYASSYWRSPPHFNRIFHGINMLVISSIWVNYNISLA